MNETKNKICIFGTGGFGREVLCCLKDSSPSKISGETCFMVHDDQFRESHIMGVEVIRFSQFDPALYAVVVAIGDPLTRKKIVDSLPSDTTFATIIHPTAVISDWVEIGEGSIISAGVVLTCNINIGKHAHLNLHTSIGHDTITGDYFTTAPGARVNGNCRLGNGVYLGTNASVRQELNICDNVIIGMGGIVVKDITEPGAYVGNPVKKLKKNS